MSNLTNYGNIRIPENYWNSSKKNGVYMLEYEEIANMQIQLNKQNALIKNLERIKFIAINALEAIEDSGSTSIANLAMEEIKNVEKFPND